MLISAWLSSVRNRFQSSRPRNRRVQRNPTAAASEGLEVRALLTTTLQAVRPNVGEFLVQNEIRTIAPQELTLQFSLGSTITPSSINSDSIQVFRSGLDGIFGNGNDVPVTIGYVGPGTSSNDVVLRFGENLADDHYRIITHGTGTDKLTATVLTAGGPVADPVLDSTFDFELDLGARIVAVDPQPVTRLANGTLSQARDKIVLYFNDDDLKLSSAQNVNFYQLIYTNDSVTSLDDVVHTPVLADYDATADTVTLTFASDIATLSGSGSYRLRVGNAETLPQAPVTSIVGVDPGSSFATANTLIGISNSTTNTSRVITSSIDPQLLAFAFPGANDEPGHREVEVETHLNGGADTGASGIPYISYNFKDDYGSDPFGNPLHNLITEAQKDRAREVFQFYSEYAGIDFRETAASGLTIATGDLRVLSPTIPTGPGGVGGIAGGSLAIMDMAETWSDLPGGSWFSVAMHEIGHLLGQGHTYDQPAPTVQGSGSSGSVGTNVEPALPGDVDIVHLQHMYRPDSIDIDLYRFQVSATSQFTAEIMAERLANSSPLDSVLRLYREVGGQRELIAQNDNYFSKDSFLDLTLQPGVYYIGVSSTGNDAYDPTIANTGIGGTSQGAYDLRVNFRPNITGVTSTIVDTTDRTFDGDSDGLQGGVYNFWFKTASSADTIFVDKSTVTALSTAATAAATQIVVKSVAPYAVNDVIRIDNEQLRITAINPATRVLTVTRAVNATIAANHSVGASIRKTSATGQIGAPFGYIGDAISPSVATPGKIVRIVGNGGADNNITTIGDNLPYEIGRNTANQALSDGSSLEVPQGVTVMFDAGAVLKMRLSWVGAGSSTTSVDRSGSALQVLGIPGQQVIFTSWADDSIGTNTTDAPAAPDEGDWGGLIFRNEIDRAQNRFNSENEGIFLNYVSYADIRWGGGTVTIDTTTQTINPIHMDRSQPTIVNNTIQFSDDSAMSADPDSFEELTFHSPRFQAGKPAFTVDYKRIGPEIYGNTLLHNGNNALFVRIDTLALGATQKMTVPGRFNDTDIVHLVAQNLELQGTPSGAYQESIAPSVTLVALNTGTGGTLAAGTYNYRIVFTDENGFESPASVATGSRTLAATGSINIAQLPPATGVYTGRRIYRSQNTGGGTYTLIADLDKSATTFVDTGKTLTRTLSATAAQPKDRARLDARLSIDPGIIVKLQGSRIQVGMGAQLIAEGAPGRQVIFTSRLDDRYGAGGTFDTNNDDAAGPSETTPSAGNWGGLYIGQLASASIDKALITFGGGTVPVGSGFAAINPVEIHQAKVRIRNTSFERNAAGGPSGNRTELFSNAPGTIFVRAAQPVVLDNIFLNNAGPVVNINVNALNKDFLTDYGRSTGLADRELNYGDNQGPLIRDNVLDGNAQNGMVVRGETLTTQSIWDDTDIVHILLDEVYVPNMHTYGGIRLESSSNQSLVVKLSGANAGFTAGGTKADIIDRIGGMLHIIGQPGQPVVLTSLKDDTAGAGFNLKGLLQKDTNGDGASVATPGDWRGINIDRYSHDRNVAVYVENEVADRLSADTNATTPEVIGALAEKPQWADENLRLGIDLHGFIDNPADVDVYSFSGVAGTQVWIDIDRTTNALDTVVELLDSTGQILAQSDNYLNEKLGTWQVVTSAGGSVQAFGLDYSPYLSDDHYTTNPRDAGFRVVLPGTTGVRSAFFVRVRSSNIDSTTGAPRTDLQDLAKINNGLTTGVYQLQVRLQEEDEFAGTTIQYADIRFATTGINITGQPIHSPLTGESEEFGDNNTAANGNPLGNVMDSDRGALAVRGTISNVADVDFYSFEVNYTHTQQIAGVSLGAPHVPVVFDLDYADGMARADLTMAIYDSTGRLILIGRDSNIVDDQPGPQEGSDLDDLSRGSVGTFDPFIGSVELPGGTYSLAVFNNRQLPQVLDQFFSATSNSPLLRVEPVNSVRRVFEERFTADDNDLFTTATAPTTNLFNVGPGGVIDPKHVVSYHLGDVVLFVSINGGLQGTDETTIATLNPFTGQIVTRLGSFGASVGDIAMRPDGQLYSFSTGAGSGAADSADNAANTGNYLRIDTGTAATTVIGDDGIAVNLNNDIAPTPPPIPPFDYDDTIVTYTDGSIRFNAMTYTGTGDKNLFAVGNRFDHDLPAGAEVEAAYVDNILYRFDIRTGAVDGNGVDRVTTDSEAAVLGAGTTQREVGRINATGTVMGIASIAGQMYAVDDGGALYAVNSTNASATFRRSFGGVSFTSLVAGPDEVEGGKYANILFAMTTTGNLMAFDTAGVLQPVFFNGQSTISTGVSGGSTGLAFSTLDRNLWATTNNSQNSRGTDLGHGVETRFDDSVLATRQQGGNSLYFGNQRTGADAGNQNNLDSGLIRNVDFPGGAHGSVISNSFSLDGYTSKDKPVLYFNYFLETENAEWDPTTSPATLMRDSFRVFIADESGNWNLVSTNDSYQSSTRADEFDYGPDGTTTRAPTTQTFPDVVETFDNTNGWRQARIDLSNYAGRANLRLRFDFSTAGSMNLGDVLTTGSELRAIDGSKLRDGNVFTIDGVNFEFDMGSTLVVPSGATAIGQSFTLGGQVFSFAATPGGPNTIVVAVTDSSSDVATKVRGVVNSVLGANSALLPNALVLIGNRVTFPGRTVTAASSALTIDGNAGVAGGSRAVPVAPNMTANQVAVAIRQALANEFSGGDITNIKGHEELVWIIGHSVTAAGPLGYANTLPGDAFGAFNASFQNGVANRPGSLRGMNNAVEGVYIDDIVLGFADRGEMIINAPVDTTFTTNIDIADDYPVGNLYLGIDVGPYDVEIRRASDYGSSGKVSPTNALYGTIDTNDRLAKLVSLTLPSAPRIVDGSTITISDGINQVIFQFLDSRGTTPVSPGAFAIPFSTETSFTLASRLRDAINSVTAQNVIRIKASLNGSRLHLTGNAIVTVSSDIAANVLVQAFNAFGDQNQPRDQGQLIVRSSFITDSSNFGIVADATVRDPGALPGAGSVRNLSTINTSRLVTGVVIMNNVIVANVAGGIRFSGDQTGDPFGQVPYGRIVNNTIVGTGGGTGILVEQSASPTILNNIVADFGVGISVDGTSQSAGTTIGTTIYRGNGTNSNAGLGTYPYVLSPTDPLFVDQANRNFYPAPNSRVIDSSLTSLGDRNALLQVKDPLDLDGADDKGSPIIAPEFDVYGQLRGNDPDVETPVGQGVSVTFDRGAIDRVDFVQPIALLSNPEDQSLLDGDSDVNEVWIDQSQILRQIRLRLVDEGIGIDNLSINKSQFVLKRVENDGVTETTLIEGVDYQFVYNEVTREVSFNAATFFADENTEVRYIILVDNDGTGPGDTVNGVRDLAGNYLLPNQADGTTRFDIVLTDGVNDPPENNVPGSQTTPEDVPLVFSVANSNLISIFDQDAHLGTNVLTVTLTATNGTLTLGAIPATLTFDLGDGTLDLAMTFTGKLQDINAALAGLTFVPDLDYSGPASVTILTNDLGEFSGPPESTSTTINITVTPVNDPPTFTLAGNPATISEDDVLQTVANFMTGQSVGPANESGQTFQVPQLTVLSVTGSWTTSTFFSQAPAIDPVTGTLTYRTAQDVNGTATIQVILTDTGTPAASSLPQTFVITVNPVNDAPVFTPNSGVGPIDASGNITTLEDAGIQAINYIATSNAARATALDELGGQTPFTWSLSTATIVSGNLSLTQLAVDPATGTLTYDTALNTAGSATVLLTLTDGGSGVSPNVNLTTRIITINVTQVNDAPIASTGNYVVDEGYGITLIATATDVDIPLGDTLTYAWDLDNDGTFETSTGGSPSQTFTWAYLSGLGITAPGVRTISLRVTDSSGAANNSDTVTATLTTLIVDYGDAPNSYGTLKASNGAAHTIANGLFLGAGVTKETNGQPSAAANLDSGDDGVIFPISFETVVGQALPAYVDVTASAAGKLDIWLDLNGNGVFDHPTDHLNAGVSYNVVPGVNRINFTIPGGATVGDTFMRFRLSTAGSLSPTGRANDGEVEDYAVKIKALPAAVTPVINRPIDFNLADGRIPQTSDLTPTIVWSQHDANFAYKLVVTNSSNVPVFTVDTTPLSTATVPSNLPAGIYTATVTAYNRALTAATPAIWQFQVVPLVVASPVGNVVTSRPTINWNAVEGTKTYNVVVESLTTGATVINQTITTASVVAPVLPNQFIPTSDLPLGRYQVRVRATDAADLPGDWSPFVNFTVKTAPVLTAPAATVSVLRPTVTWNPVAGATTYLVTLTFFTDNGVLPVTTTVSGTSWTPTEDLRLGEYRVTVQAFNAVNEISNVSAVRSFLVQKSPISSQPLGRVPDTTPTFAWNAVVGADRYELVVSKKFGALDVVVNQTSLTNNFYTQPSELGLGRYTYRIRAVNTPSNSSATQVVSNYSPVYEFVITQPPVVTAPALTTFSNHPTITWVNPPNAEKSEVWIDEVGGQSEFVHVYNIAGTSYTPNEKLFGIGVYRVWVRTYSNTDNPATTADERELSNWSVVRTFRVSTPPVLVGPTGRTSDASPTLSWKSVPGGLSYEVWIDNNTVPVRNLFANQTPNPNKGINSLSYTVPADLPIGQYTFWVRAYNASGVTSNWSLPQDFSVVTAPILSGPSEATLNVRPTFTWTNQMTTLDSRSTGVERYEFRLYLTNSTNTSEVELPSYRRTDLTTNTYTIPTNLPFGSYRAYVRGIGKENLDTGAAATTTNWSSALHFVVGGGPLVNPLAPTTNTRPTLSWQAVNGATGYDVFVGTLAAPGVNILSAGNARSAGTSFVMPQALAKGEYRYWIRAFNTTTGTVGVWSQANTLKIVDAGNSEQQPLFSGTTEFVWTIVPGLVPQSMVTESTISMLPALIDGSQYLPMPEELLNAKTEVRVLPLESAANTAATIEGEVTTAQTDSILSQWQEHAWWESKPETAIPDKVSQKTSAAGFLGALFALAPRSLRRRKDE
jgi:hypothetical protein